LRTISWHCELNYEHLSAISRGLGNPTFETLMELCKGLDMTIGELMTTLDDFLGDRARE
jgi:transcriptional regulator with XRE-family HTH domain